MTPILDDKKKTTSHLSLISFKNKIIYMYMRFVLIVIYLSIINYILYYIEGLWVYEII